MQAHTGRFLPLVEGPAAGDALASWLRSIAQHRDHRGALAHWEVLPARPARYGELAIPLAGPLRVCLDGLGIERLYTHQVHAIEAQRAGRDTVIVTGTASGKTLGYHLPVLETLLREPDATALYLFPTKALAQDQLQGLTRLAGGHLDVMNALVAGVYDGDTQATTRRRLRDEGNLILSNPDMLHQGILPAHARWGRFFSRLRHVVVDEMHAYRGIFGSHVANVLRRLERVAEHHGSRFRYVLCSATIRNPGELASALTGREVTVVDDDGSPRGTKHFVFWNPPYTDASRIERRSSNGEGCTLFAGLIEQGAQTLAFTKSRVAAELVYRYATERLASRSERAGEGHAAARELARPLFEVPPGRPLSERIKPYRGGYLPEERRAIERALFAGELRGVVSTNALELGVDIGGLDAVVMIGAPPTLASAWQQAGRAGRKAQASLAILVAYNETVDQYLMHHPEYFFGRSPEGACIDPQNPYILAQQLACAAHELPLGAGDGPRFGAQTPAVLEALEDSGETRTIDGRTYWASSEFPAKRVNLRQISDDTYTIMNVKDGNAVVGTVDAISALELLYPEAIYLHEGETFYVRELDLQQKVAFVEPREVDYYTQPVLDTKIAIREELRAREWGARGPQGQGSGERVHLGDVTYSWQTLAMKKIRFHSRDAIGYHPLELPRLTLETTGFWLALSPEARSAVARAGENPIEGLSGVRNLFLKLLALLTMCDPFDLGGKIDSSQLGQPALFLFDRYPGGLGFSEQGWTRLEELAASALEHLEACDCEAGCPACVGLPILRPAQQQDPDLGRGVDMPGKRAAALLLRHWGAGS